MNIDQFRQLAQTWGGDLARWPAAERDAAQAVADSEVGAAILREQRDFDAMLSVPSEVSPARAGRASLAVLQRIAAAESRPPWYRLLLRPSALLPAGSLACSALLGIWMASTLPYHPSDEALSAVSAVFDASAISLWGNQ
jgi:hypothetical protein